MAVVVREDSDEGNDAPVFQVGLVLLAANALAHRRHQVASSTAAEQRVNEGQEIGVGGMSVVDFELAEEEE